MAEQLKKRCLYDVLSVSSDCSQEEIRSAYKRLTLQLHPDELAQSSAASAGDATAAFQDLLNAYEVLSDPKERAWYDSHSYQILFSDSSSASKLYSSFFDLDLLSFFSKSVYCGYTDSAKGFFKVYGDVFAKIYDQELKFAEKKLGFLSVAVAPAPLIGNLDSPYSQVTAFYTYWLGFSTVMNFVWIDGYDFVGHTRKARRRMEEENKKERKMAKREHNETVRALAAFVKKRDKRVLDMQMKKHEEKEKRQAEEKERKKMERAMVYQEPDWAKKDQEESKMIWDDDEDDQRKKKGNCEVEMYSVVCNKKFKSEKQWKNPEQSKKHWEKVAELQSAFDDEDEALKDVGREGLMCEF